MDWSDIGPRGGGALKAFFTAPLLVSAVVFGIAMLQFVNRIGLYNQLSGLVLAHVVLVVPFAIRSLEVTLRAVPEELEWAAMILGRSRMGMLLRVTLPLCARGLVTAFLFCFLLSFSGSDDHGLHDGTGAADLAGADLQLYVRPHRSDRRRRLRAGGHDLAVCWSRCLNLLGGLRRLTTRIRTR